MRRNRHTEEKTDGMSADAGKQIMLTAAETDAMAIDGAKPALVRNGGGAEYLTDQHKARILAGVRSGQSLATVLRLNPDLPGATALSKARRTDEQFEADLMQARAEGMEATIEEAVDFAHAVRGNKQLAIAASKYTDAVLKSAALMVPKRFGASMLKIAGADGERLSIAIVAYAAKPDAPQAIETTATPLLPATDKATD